MRVDTNKASLLRTIVLLVACLGIAPLAPADIEVDPADKLTFQQVGEVQDVFIVEPSGCNTNVFITSLDLSIVKVTSSNPQEGENITFELTAQGIGDTFIKVEYAEDIIPGSGCGASGSITIPVIVGPRPLKIFVRDSTNNSAINNANVYIQDKNSPSGFEAYPIGGAEYWSPRADFESYDVVAVAPGYEPSSSSSLEQDPTGAVSGTIFLDPDTSGTLVNTIRVVIDLLDDGGNSSGAVLLTDTVDLQDGAGNSLGLSPIFGNGEMIFIGVTPGITRATAPDTDDFDFTDATETVGTGVDEIIIMTAKALAGTGQGTYTKRGFSTRAGFQGDIVGDVSNTTAAPVETLANAIIISKQQFSDIATQVEANVIGAFFHPNIQPGNGEIWALSPDLTIEGPKLPVDITAGQTFGDDPSEETSLQVPLDGGDSDHDGLPDAWETTYLASVPSNQRGPNDDPDGDGLTNLEELLILLDPEDILSSTDPDNHDTDGDGWSDGVEMVRATNPHIGQSQPTLLDEVWVDFGYLGTIEAGTLEHPAKTIETALTLKSNEGVIEIKGDVSDTTGQLTTNTINTPATINAFNGAITLDAPLGE